MDDAAAFLGSYKQALAQEVVAGGIWPPELVGLYEPESCLKHSGAKEVYLVTDRRTGGRVVLRASDLDAGERADVEHVILSRLDFPGIPKTYGTFVKDGRSYLAREYFEGEPLDQVIARGTFTPPQILQIARQVCAILGYLHAQDPPVIHRDIKPQNIILRPDGSIGLTDFGIARTYKASSTSDTQQMGTLLYAPPEQYGYAQSSPQTDIYALGIVMIYLATGYPDRRDFSTRIADARLRSLIEKCIAFDPQDRFQNVQQVLRRIDSFKTRRLRRALGIAAACCAVVLLVVGGWFVANNLLGGERQPAGTVLGQGDGTGNEEDGSGGADGSGADGSGAGGAGGSDGDGTPGTTGTPGTPSEDSDFLSALSNADYSSINNPRPGTHNWLYDYNYAGNLQGNINNGGFAASADNGSSLFVISDGSIYKLNNKGDVVAEVYSGGAKGGLNICGTNLYFTDTRGTIRRIELRVGFNVTTFEDIRADKIYFDNGRLYYTDILDNLSLYTCKTNGATPTLTDVAAQAYYSNIVEGVRFYCDGTDGNRIYARELSTGKTALVFDKPATWISVWNGRIYFGDSTESCLSSIKLDGSDYQVVYGQPCYYLVASTRGIFAVDAIKNELFVVGFNSGNHQVLLDESVEFCVAGDWVVYRNRNSDTVLGMVRQDGTESKLFPAPAATG